MIRPIHPIGPAVGEYVPSFATDIRQTFARLRFEASRGRLAESGNYVDIRDSAPEQSPPDRDDDAGLEVVELLGPDDLSPGLGAVLLTEAEFA